MLRRPAALAALAALLALGQPAVAQQHHHPAPAAAEPAGTGQDTIRLGDVTIAEGWSRATPPMAQVGAGYMTIRNAGASPVRLLGGSSSVSEGVELHSMTMQNDVMTMREITDGLEIPAGGELALAPGGYHLMLVGLEAPLREGETVSVQLDFDTGSVDVPLAVGAIGARSGGTDHSGH